MHSAFSELQHRPWPLPSSPWTWRQSWRDLLFAHWPVAAERLRPLVPPGLAVQTFGGTSWVGVVPFRMAGVMRRYLPDVPGVSAFPELNLRLYVEADGRPGVWFLSLDAPPPPVVWAARRFFHLPYHRARIAFAEQGGRVHADIHRLGTDIRVTADYAPSGPVERTVPGTLAHWLTERYCLYAQRPDGVLLRNEVHHVPWPLQPADARIDAGPLLSAYGLAADGPPLCHFARRIDVVVWDAERVGAGPR